MATTLDFTITANTNFQATYTINTYTVTWKNWDGSTVSTTQVEHGKAATPPANPTRPNYTFKAWDKAYSNITSDITITALFDIAQYTVKFLDHDNSVLNTQTVSHGGTATPPANPSRDGYKFIGWERK